MNKVDMCDITQQEKFSCYKIIYTKKQNKTIQQSPSSNILCCRGKLKEFKKSKIKRFVYRWYLYRRTFSVTKSLFKIGSRGSFRSFYIRTSFLLSSDKRSKLSNTEFKINTMVRKMTAVQQVMRCIFDLQTTEALGIHMKYMLIKMTKT